MGVVRIDATIDASSGIREGIDVLVDAYLENSRHPRLEGCRLDVTRLVLTWACAVLATKERMLDALPVKSRRRTRVFRRRINAKDWGVMKTRAGSLCGFEQISTSPSGVDHVRVNLT